MASVLQILQIQHLWTFLLLKTIQRQIETQCFLFINICFFYLNSQYVFFLISVIHLDDENKNHLLYITHSV